MMMILLMETGRRPVLDDDLFVDVDSVVVVSLDELECGQRQLIGDAAIESFHAANLGRLVAEFVRRMQHQTISQSALCT